MKATKILCFIAIVLCQNCAIKEKEDVKQIDIQLSNENVFDYAKHFELNRFIRLQTNEVISNIQGVGQIGNNLIVHCRKPANLILIKNMITQNEVLINQKGEGPEQFFNFTNFCISESGKTFFILDNKKGRITEVDTTGNIIRSFKNDLLNTTYSISHLRDETFALHGGSFFYGTVGSQLAVYDFNKEELSESFFPIPNNHQNLLFMERNNFTRNKGLYHNVLDHKLYRLSENSIQAEYNFNFINQNLPESYLSEEYDGLMEFVHTMRDSGYPYDLSNFIEDDNYIYFTFRYQGEIHHVLHDFNSNRSTVFDELTNNLYGFSDKKVKATFAKIPLGTFDSGLVFQINPFEEIEIMKKLKSKLDKKQWENIQSSREGWFKQFEDLNQNSNPILVLLNFKK